MSFRDEGVGAVDVESVGGFEVVASGCELMGEVELGEEGGGGKDFNADEARKKIGDEGVPAEAAIGFVNAVSGALFGECAMDVVEGGEEKDAGAAGGIEEKRGVRSAERGVKNRIPLCRP